MSAYSNQRAPGREHIPVFPKGFIAIRIIQLVLSLVVIGLSAFGLSILSFDGAALNIFTVCFYHLLIPLPVSRPLLTRTEKRVSQP